MPNKYVSNSSPLKESNNPTDVQVIKKTAPLRRYRPKIPFPERLVEAERQQKTEVNMAKEKSASQVWKKREDPQQYERK